MTLRCRYKEWKATHNSELAKVKRQAKQAEMKILRLEGENAAQRAVLRRREEEKAAVQRRTRDVALLSAAAGVIVVVQADNNAHWCPCS